MKPKILRTYNSVWKVEKVLYGIQDIPLPIPITYRQIGFFGTGVLLMYVLNYFPPFSLLHLGLIEYVFLPGLFSWFFTKKLLDGKAPHRFLLSVLMYHFSPHLLNRYKEIADIKTYKYTGTVGYRTLHRIRGEDDDEH